MQKLFLLIEECLRLVQAGRSLYRVENVANTCSACKRYMQKKLVPLI